jgi:hypothetical protein
MDRELDKFICTELKIRIKPLEMWDLVIFIERYKNDCVVKKHKHKIYGQTVCVYKSQKLCRRYYWDRAYDKLRCFERYARRSTAAASALDTTPGTIYATKLLYLWLIDYLCYRKGPNWICIKKKNGKR